MVEGGTAHGLEQSTCVSMGCPLPLYIKEGRRRGPAKGRGTPKGGNPTPSRFAPSFLLLLSLSFPLSYSY